MRLIEGTTPQEYKKQCLDISGVQSIVEYGELKIGDTVEGIYTIECMFIHLVGSDVDAWALVTDMLGDTYEYEFTYMGRVSIPSTQKQEEAAPVEPEAEPDMCPICDGWYGACGCGYRREPEPVLNDPITIYQETVEPTGEVLVLRIDIETYCDLNIMDVGAYKYTEHPSFEVLMAAYKLGDGPTKLIDFCTGDPDDFDYLMEVEEFKSMLLDPRLKRAFNANFERLGLGRWFNEPMPASEWRCTMVEAYSMGLPGSLAGAGAALQVAADKTKDKEGKALINYFCKPCKPTKKNGKRTRNLPEHDPEKWELFKAYCIQDVEAEKAIEDIISPFTNIDWDLWALDQEINDRGVKLDRQLFESAILYNANHKAKLLERAKEITGLDNPNSDKQLKEWITENTGVDAFALGLTKESVPKMLAATDDPRLKEVLEIRLANKKTSNAKYNKMDECQMDDERARGLLQFNGAGRTCRWAGRLLQVQNLPQNKIEDLDLARDLLREGQHDFIDMMYEKGTSILSQLIRTAFIPKDHNIFYVADFSAIEAVDLAWLAGEQWRMKVFNSHGKIYEASASQMFKVPIDQIKKGGERYDLRAKGKIAELALGYGGAKGALKAMGAIDMGIPEKELQPLVNVWRRSNKAITALWWAVGDAALDAVRNPGVIQETHGLKFVVESQYLFITLPSGRRLVYVRPYITEGKFNKEQLMFEGMDQTKKIWTHIDTYGPKLVENIVQGIARDILAYSMMNLKKAGYEIVMHVHDEVIIEAPSIEAGMSSDVVMDRITAIMAERPEWAKDLPLRADGYTCEFYKKD